jgi:hypothetical protein
MLNHRLSEKKNFIAGEVLSLCCGCFRQDPELGFYAFAGMTAQAGAGITATTGFF